jgi:hypothetical protein
VTGLRAAAIALSLSVAAFGIWRGTHAVGGSDSSCYALMAQAFSRGQLQPTSALAHTAPWDNAATTFAPGGFVPSPVRPDAASPVCAPGFSLLLTVFAAVGGRDAVFLASPVAGACLVWLTFVFGARMASELTGLASALVLALTPVFVFQLVQPMNDVTAAALLLAVMVLAAGDRQPPAMMGALTGLLVLVRPNLVPVAVLVAIWCAVRGARALMMFVIALTPAIAILLALNHSLYGAALSSGYGRVGELFALTNIPANLQNYGSALWNTQLGFPLIGAAALLIARRTRRDVVWLALGSAGAISVVYLLYQPLREWWYLRFFLPALPLLLVLAFTTLDTALKRRLPIVVVAAAIAIYGATTPAMREGRDLQRLEQRFRLAAHVAAERLPPDAVYLTVWESGSVRFHADREAVLWDSLPPAQLDMAVEWLTAQQRRPLLMLEDWEEPLFRAHFRGASPLGELDWPPRFVIDRRVRVYAPEDRARFWRGETVPTQHITADRP